MRCREDCPWKGYRYDNIIRHICTDVLEHFEFREYIQSDSEGLWSITQAGIDHFFRLEADE